MTRLRNVAVVLGRTGTRIGLNIPKQLIKIAGKPIIEHTIAAMQQSPLVDEIVVMMAPGHLDEVRAIVKKGDYFKVTQILEGAETRNGTTAAALAALGDEECNVLLHDAVRPLVSQTIIAANVDALQRYEAVDTAIPSADTVIQVTPTTATSSTCCPGTCCVAVRPHNRSAFDDQGRVREGSLWIPVSCHRRLHGGTPLSARGLDRSRRRTRTQHEGHRAHRRLYRGEANESGPPPDRPTPLTNEQYHARLDGRTVVVFGGSYGIGGDIAELARAYGANVKTFSRSTTGTYVEKRADVAKVAQQVVAETGRIDFVVNTAGVLVRGELAETSEETIYSSTDINYLAPIFVAQEFYPHLAASCGSLLLFTSSSYTRGRSGYSLYLGKGGDCESDAGAGRRVGLLGVRVNCVNPERTGTPMRAKAFGEEPAGTLLSSEVARQSLDVLLLT